MKWGGYAMANKETMRSLPRSLREFYLGRYLTEIAARCLVVESMRSGNFGAGSKSARMMAKEKPMEYLVDAGRIVKVQEVSERAAASAVAIDLGIRASYPITVHTPSTGARSVFIEAAKKSAESVSQAKTKKARA